MSNFKKIRGGGGGGGGAGGGGGGRAAPPSTTPRGHVCHGSQSNCLDEEEALLSRRFSEP
jgi:hypothetical protein